MEQRSYQVIQYTPEQLKRREEESNLRAEAAKTYGKYIIAISNKCFEKCSDVGNLYISKSETKCLEACFHKTTEANDYALQKFSEINKGFNYNISENLLANPIDLFK
jgi:hypothetical protein